jgi:uncharacterized protein with PIN domain
MSEERLFNMLLDIWANAESYSKEEVLSVYEQLCEKIIASGSKVGKNTLKLIKEMRLENNKCPQCGSELTTKDEIVNVGEARGCPYSEINQCRICPICHWKEED